MRGVIFCITNYDRRNGITNESIRESESDSESGIQNEIEGLTELVENAVDRGARSVEEIHREIAGLPLTVLETIGIDGDSTKELRRIQDESIGAVYDVIRSVNHRVAELAQGLLELDSSDDTDAS